MVSLRFCPRGDALKPSISVASEINTGVAGYVAVHMRRNTSTQPLYSVVLNQHYVRVYQTGNTYDCGSPGCKLSSAHMHKTARNCGCNTVRRLFLSSSPLSSSRRPLHCASRSRLFTLAFILISIHCISGNSRCAMCVSCCT